MLPPPNRQSRNGKGNPTLAIVIVVAAVILLNAAATVGAYILVLAIPIAIVVAVTAAAVSAAKKQRPAPKPEKPAACPNPEPHRHYDLEDDCPNPEPHRHATARYQPPRVPKAPKREYDTFVQPVKNWPTAAERRRENMKHLYEAGLLTREEYQAELQKRKVLEV